MRKFSPMGWTRRIGSFYAPGHLYKPLSPVIMFPAMSENGKKHQENDLRKMLELNEREKEGAIYIGGVVLLIVLIVGLASLTHVVLSP